MTQSAKNEPAQEPREAPRRGYARPAGEDALGHAAQALGRAGFADSTLVLRWAKIAGGEVARVAEPLKLQEGPEGAVLTLKSDPAAAIFLQHETRTLIERLNAYLGGQRIVRIRLVAGEMPPPVESPVHPGLGLPLATQPERITGLQDALERFARLRAEIRSKFGHR